MNFAGLKTDAMFAVYDGHGSQGHSCANYAKEKLPKTIAKHIRKKRSQKYQGILQQQQPKATTKKKQRGWDPDNWPMLTQREYEQCCHKAFLECNQGMHDDPKVKDKMSGTTAVTVCFHDNFVSICNVGDSRVVLGHRICDSSSSEDGKAVTTTSFTQESRQSTSSSSPSEEEKTDIDDEMYIEAEQARGNNNVLPEKKATRFSHDRERLPAPPGSRVLAIPLTRDQTAYRRDERERVKKCGASVMSIDQMEGKEPIHENWGDMVLGEDVDTLGDPPRIWIKGKDYPGCAFTRSLGDHYAEYIGVNAEPEILTKELTKNDEFLIIASDGIFEFIPNQLAMDVCAASESPIIACEKLVKEAYQQWLVHETRTDDITLIVCFLRNFQTPQSNEDSKGTTEDLIKTVVSGDVYGSESVRVSATKSSRDLIPSGPLVSSLLPKEKSANVQKEDSYSQEGSALIPTEEEIPSLPAPMEMDLDLDIEQEDVKLESVMAVAHGISKTRQSGLETSSTISRNNINI